MAPVKGQGCWAAAQNVLETHKVALIIGEDEGRHDLTRSGRALACAVLLQSSD